MNTHPPASYGSTVLRAGLGLVMLAHGLAKIFLYTMPGTVAFFEAAGFPGLLAWPVMLAELAGGTLLVSGLFTRWAALAMVPVLAGATSVHWSSGWLFTNPNGGWEFPAFLAAASLALFLHGDDGRLSAAAWFRRRRVPKAALSGRRAEVGAIHGGRGQET